MKYVRTIVTIGFNILHQIFTSYSSLMQLEEEDRKDIDSEKKSQKNRTKRFFQAIGLLFASRSEMLCYLLMILDQMYYGSLLSLPLPFMVFLWGMLSVPRPSKTFWVTVITYTEVSELKIHWTSVLFKVNVLSCIFTYSHQFLISKEKSSWIYVSQKWHHWIIT